MTSPNEKQENGQTKRFSLFKTAFVNQDDPAESSGFWKFFTTLIVGGALLIIAIFAYLIYDFTATEVPPAAAPPGLTTAEPGPAEPTEPADSPAESPALHPAEDEAERQLNLEGLEVYRDDEGIWRSNAALTTKQDEVYLDEDGVWRNRVVQPEKGPAVAVQGLDPTLNFLLGQVLTEDQLSVVNTVAGTEPSLEGLMKLMTGDQLDFLKDASAGLDPSTEGLSGLMSLLGQQMAGAAGVPPAAGRAYVETGSRRLMMDNHQSPANMVNEPLAEPLDLNSYEQFDPNRTSGAESPWEQFEDPR